MTAEVRLYSFNALVSTPIAKGGSDRPNSDSLFLLKQPYLAGQVLTADSTAVTSDAATAPQHTQLLQVQIQPNKTIHYEVTPEGHTLREATAASPLLRNDTFLHFQAGWRLSVLEKTE